MASKVRDIMTRPVIFATVDMTIRELMDLLREKGISGVPVTDDELRLVGVISEADLIRLDLAGQAEPHDSFSLREGVMSVERTYTMEQLDQRVSEVMVAKVLTVDASAPIKAACTLFAEHRVHRLVVMEGDEIAGIVTPVDIVRALADGTLTLDA